MIKFLQIKPSKNQSLDCSRRLFFLLVLNLFILGSLSAQTPAGALNFDGTNDFVQLGNTGNYLQEITISALIYRTGNNASGFDEIWSKNFINTFSIRNSNNRLYVNFGNGSVWGTAVQSTVAIPLNQ